MNPLLLRELRQLVRNRFIIVLINLFLGLLVFLCVTAVAFQDRNGPLGNGSGLFLSLASSMNFACLLAVVAYTAVTTASERIGGDLMYASTMRPATIVFGKAWAGVVLTVLLMSITAPFVTLAYLLRGLDMETVAASFLTIFVGIQVMNAVAVCLFANVKTRVQMAVMMFPCAIVGMFCYGLVLRSISLRTVIGTAVDWNGIGGAILIAVAALAVLFAAAVASIAPPTSNRLLPLRIVLTVLYVGSFAICRYLPSRIPHAAPDAVWAEFWIILLTVLMLQVVSERETWSYRVRRSLPRNILLRGLVFPFYTGSPCGLVWLGLLLGAALPVLYATRANIHSLGDTLPLWVLFALDYCITAMLLRSRLALKSLPPEKTWTIALILLVVCSVGGLLIGFFLYSETRSNLDFLDYYAGSWFSVLNPFLIGRENDSAASLRAYTAVGWAALLALPLLVWFVRRVRRFSPDNLADAMTLDQAADAVRRADENPMVKGNSESLAYNKSRNGGGTPP